MAELTLREKLEITLDRKISELDADAKDNGHRPHSWTINSDWSAVTYCATCGRSAVVRIMDRGDRVWASPLPKTCEGKGR